MEHNQVDVEFVSALFEMFLQVFADLVGVRLGNGDKDVMDSVSLQILELVAYHRFIDDSTHSGQLDRVVGIVNHFVYLRV